MALRTDNMMTGSSGPRQFQQTSLLTAFREIPFVDLALADRDPAAFFAQLKYATADVGFCLLKNAPGLDSEFQDKVFRQALDFFDGPEDKKLQCDIRKDEHFRGASRQDRVKDIKLNVNMQVRGRNSTLKSCERNFDLFVSSDRRIFNFVTCIEWRHSLDSSFEGLPFRIRPAGLHRSNGAALETCSQRPEPMAGPEMAAGIQTRDQRIPRPLRGAGKAACQVDLPDAGCG